MKRLLIVLGVLSLLVAACGGSNKVGSNSLLNVGDQARKGPRLGEATTSTAPAATSTSVASLGLGRPTTTRPPTATTVKQEFVIEINPDKAGGKSQFEPNTASVYTGYPVRWHNADTVTRSVVFDDGKRSPDIPAGQSWSTSFSAPGTYHYSDGTRPYAVASITVVAR